MKPESIIRRRSVRLTSAALIPATLVTAAMYAASCASSSSPSPAPIAAGMPAVAPAPTITPPSPDPRVGLEAGYLDAEQAIWNLRLVANVQPPPDFFGVTNSDLAFTGDYVFQGNYNGYQVWDISNPSQPSLARAYLCPASQSDVSIFRNLLFVSGEGRGGRLDCGTQGVPDTVSMDRLRGIRIFDISDVRDPEYIANVQTCRGSHTHTVVTDPNDPANVYVYVSGSSSVRSPNELPGCVDASPDEDPNSARFRIEVIQVPLANPAAAQIVSSPRIFENLAAAPRRAGGRGGRGGRGGGGTRQGPDQCHDITAYPDAGLAGGACRGYGLLLDISNPRDPRRIDEAADSNFALWHSATFSNDGRKVLFTDEWGGGSAARCRAEDPRVLGANAIFTIDNGQMTFRSYWKLPAPQTEQENCVAHNGSLIPIPGREVMVQGWYQGGITVFDWTDPANPYEIAFFDRGPLDADELETAGSWSIYWYNGYLYSSEIKRGLDVLELTPSAALTQNEIDAAKSVRLDYFNAQQQVRFEWPASFALARAYADQLQRSNGLSAARLAAVRSALAGAEQASGAQRRDALTQLASGLNGDASSSSDGAKVQMLANAVRDLAGM